MASEWSEWGQGANGVRAHLAVKGILVVTAWAGRDALVVVRGVLRFPIDNRRGFCPIG